MKYKLLKTKKEPHTIFNPDGKYYDAGARCDNCDAVIFANPQLNKIQVPI